ncbi:MAG: hypothetical protein ABI992_00815 [Chthoniobacterales bacterium]
MRLPIFRLTTLCLLASGALAARAPRAQVAVASAPLPNVAPAAPGKLNVLILGDSLALCGFGKRLDARFREDPQVNATFTYMACGTNPLSWLKEKPYTNVKTQCGFWAIESADGKKPRELEDVYGMTTGHVPKAHPVPKLADILAATHPDILVVQTGSNLFGLFPDGRSVQTGKHAAALQKYLAPFKHEALAAGTNLRKIYWVNPPTSGRVAPEIQDFLLQQARTQLTPEMTVIDSRPLVKYPYQHMEPDKEHFLGAQMDEWADKVFDIIGHDLAAQPIASLKLLSDNSGRVAAVPTPAPVPAETPARALPVEPVLIARAEPVATPAPTPAPAPTTNEPLVVRATLVFMSHPIPLQELLPYRESLVAYVYRVDQVLRGHYDENQILVMHPAHIGAKPQRLKYRIGKRYKLRLDRIEGTLWDTAKSRDESGQINLMPYIRLEDERRHPENRTR